MVEVLENQTIEIKLDQSTDTKDIADSGFRVYPNPVTNGQLRIDFSSDFSSGNIDVFDLRGQRINRHINISSGQILDLNLPSGMYILKLQNGQEYVTKKIVISK